MKAFQWVNASTAEEAVKLLHHDFIEKPQALLP